MKRLSVLLVLALGITASPLQSQTPSGEEMLSAFQTLARSDLPPFGRSTPSNDRQRCDQTIKPVKQAKGQLKTLALDPAVRSLLEGAAEDFEAACRVLLPVELGASRVEFEELMDAYATIWLRGQEKVRLAFSPEIRSKSTEEMVSHIRDLAGSEPLRESHSFQGVVVSCWNRIYEALVVADEIKRRGLADEQSLLIIEGAGRFRAACDSLQGRNNIEYLQAWGQGSNAFSRALSDRAHEPPAPAPSAQPPARPPDSVVVQRAREVLLTVQRLSSAFELEADNDERERRLVEAHAAVEDLDASLKGVDLRLFIATLRQVVLEYRLANKHNGDEQRSIAASAKAKLGKARVILYQTVSE